MQSAPNAQKFSVQSVLQSMAKNQYAERAMDIRHIMHVVNDSSNHCQTKE
jgi:hypothetical protein